MATFKSYAAFYDLLYSEKNYHQEAAYVDTLIKQYAPQARTILDIGCGTGKHAGALGKRGYTVHGVDMSPDMLQRAHLMLQEKEFIGAQISFSQGDARSVQLTQKFDVITSLFHVASYQTTNNDIQAFLRTISQHLNPGGIVIFDFWYGPAILADRPSVRVKRIETDQLYLTRTTEPTLHHQDNCVDIAFTLFIEDKQTHDTSKVSETHRMRYFFEPELQAYCNAQDIEILTCTSWLSHDKPSLSSRDACLIGRKR